VASSSKLARRTRAVALVLLLVLVVAACGSSGSSKANNKTPSSGGVSGDTNDTGTPVNGGTLKYGIEADTSGGYCLYKAQLAIGGIQVARAFYDTLTMPGEDGKIHPFLAESVTGSNNNKTWTIKLRPNIKFHDGSPLNAQVVVDNLNHYRKDNTLFIFVFADITDVKATDNMTVTVTSKVPWTAFPWFLWSSSRLGIMAEAQMKSPDCNSKLIGTGPFMCQGDCWKFNAQTTGVKNPNYWAKSADGKQLPYLDSIVFIPQENGAQRLTSLESGDFNAIHTSGPHQIVKIRDDVKSGSLKDIESDKYAEVGYELLNNCPDTTNGCGQASPFSHLSARQAVAYSINRDEFNQVRNDGISQQATGPYAPDVPGYTADTGLPTYDLEKAKAAAAQYKQETGKDLAFTLSHTADTDTVADAQMIQSMVQKIPGVKVSLNQVADQSTLINLAIGRKFDAMLWRNHPGADPDTQYVWWHCDNGSTPKQACNNIVNFNGFNDPIISTNLDKARSEPDDSKRTALYQDVNKEFGKQLFNLWGQWTLWTVAFQPAVHGVMAYKLPDGSGTFPGLATGHPVSAMWCDNGKC
jgi:peptide/nickel transport system substrate-binding protein